MLIQYFQYFQYLSLILAIIFFRQLKLFSLQIMIPLLAIVCIVETLASNCELIGLESNIPIYNGYVIVSTPLYFILFAKIISWKPVFKRAYFIVAALTLSFLLVDMFYLERDKFASYTAIVTFMEHILLSCILLSSMAMDETREIRFTREPYFWIAAGLILFCSGTMVVLGLREFIQANGISINGLPIYRIIVPMLNVILYSCYSYAFYLCTKQEHRFSPS